MKLQVACVILILVLFSAKNSCSFQRQTEDPAGLLMQQIEPAADTQGLQALRRSKRHNTHFPICTFCCNCCRNKGCGYCCRT